MGSIPIRCCTVDGCNRKHKAHGLCVKHYQRAVYQGVIVPDPPKTFATIEDRFWAKVNKDGPKHDVLDTKCWLWTSTLLRVGGYGRFFAPRESGSKQVVAHRFSYELAYGPIPDGLLVCHKCDVPMCVNPDHLFLGTDKDNMQDMKAKGRAVDRYGSEHPGAKLTEKQVKEIREVYSTERTSAVKLGARYGVSPSLILKILHRKGWKHI